MSMYISGGKRVKEHLPQAIEQIHKPNVLIIPSASSTEEKYTKKVANYTDFFRSFGLNTEVLHTFAENPSQTEIQHKIGQAGLIYVPGGNSPKLVQKWQELGLKEELSEFCDNPSKIYAGASAGALVVFKEAFTNPSSKPKSEEWDFTFINGALGKINASATVHANMIDEPKERPRIDYFLEKRKQLQPQIVGIAIDNEACLVVDESGQLSAKYLPGSNDRISIFPNNSDEPQTLQNRDLVHASEFGINIK